VRSTGRDTFQGKTIRNREAVPSGVMDRSGNGAVCVKGRVLHSVIDKVNETEYLTALGLVAWGNHVSQEGGGFNLKLPGGEVIGKSLGKIRQWIKSLIP